MPYIVYILHSSKHDKIYIGYSSDLEKRMLSHNHLATKGWTIKFRPWNLVYQESFQNKKEAMSREKQLKSAKGRSWIRQTILNQ